SLPPLRHRIGDILPLARHFVRLFARKLGGVQTEIDAAAQQALLDYPWPGNIRELENVIHHALIVCQDEVIRLRDLRLVNLPAAPAAPSAMPHALPPASAEAPMERAAALFAELLRDPLPGLHGQ